MAYDRDRTIRDYTMLTPQVNPRIIRPKVQTDNFKLKRVMFHILQIVEQLNKLPSKYPHLHVKLLLKVSDAFKIIKASHEALTLRLFSFSLRDRART